MEECEKFGGRDGSWICVVIACDFVCVTLDEEVGGGDLLDGKFRVACRRQALARLIQG